MGVDIDWRLAQTPNIFANYLAGRQSANELARQAPPRLNGLRRGGQGAASDDGAPAGAGAEGTDDPSAVATLSGPGVDPHQMAAAHARADHAAEVLGYLSGIPAPGGDTSRRAAVLRQVAPELQAVNPNLTPEVLAGLVLSDGGLSALSDHISAAKLWLNACGR